MMKSFWLIKFLFVCLLAISQAAVSNDRVSFNQVPSLNYKDIDDILAVSVVNVGITKKRGLNARKSNWSTGTHIRYRINRTSVIEANRFLFKEVSASRLATAFPKVRESLEHVSEQIEISELPPAEQLAYWLNLYNVSMLEQLIKIYPITDLKDEISERTTFLNKKFIKHRNTRLSLNDIKYKIVLEKFKNPVVIYGFYQGNVGSPSLTSKAFTKDNVYSQLSYLAREFINSNRGLWFGEKGDIQVAEYYQGTMDVFDNEPEKFRTHLIDYARNDIRYNIRSASVITFDNANYEIAEFESQYSSFDSMQSKKINELFDRLKSWKNESYPDVAMNEHQTSTTNKVHLADQFKRVPKELLESFKVKASKL
ncbi:DUF547 domain-containing protein [Pseudoalteromonas xiamenensis]|uniref:DUF547 domain-containing protein n=1 Tax=Pseudoalteromonas xiamenensis TaxID=882626 RepID=UPI0035EEE016